MKVATVHTGTGHDQVPHAGQSREGFGLTAHGNAQAGQLRVAAGDEGGLGVVAVAQAHGNAHRQRNDVFDRAAQLNASTVGGGIHPEGGCGENLLHPPGRSRIGAARHNDGGQVTGHLLGVGGTGERHHTAVVPAARPGKLLLDDLGHGHQGLFLHALGHIHDNLAVGNMGCSLLGRGSHKNRGHRKEQNVPVAADFLDIGGKVHPLRQNHARKVGVGVGGAQGYQLLRQSAPHGHIAAVHGQQTGQRGAPGAGTQNTDFQIDHS